MPARFYWVVPFKHLPNLIPHYVHVLSVLTSCGSSVFNRTYKTYIENREPEIAANTLICLVHQTNYLLDRQLRQLEQLFLKQGGFTEKLYHARKNARRRF